MSKIDPPAGWPDIDGIDTHERLLGGPLPNSPINRSIGNLTSRTKQLRDDISAAGTTLAAPTGSGQVGFQQTGASSVARTVLAKLRETFSAADFTTAEAAITAAVAAGLPFNTANGAWGGIPFANELAGKKVRVVAGTVRQNGADPTKWDWINDSGHIPVGFRTEPTDISASGSDLSLTFSETFTKVVAVVAGPDEEFASTYSATVGASVSLDSMVLRMAVNMRAAGRVWFDGTDWQHRQMTGGAEEVGPTPTFSSGTLTVPHARVFGGVWNPAAVGPDTRNAAIVPIQPALRDSSTTAEFRVNFIADGGGSLVTTASDRMSFWYAKQFTGPIRLDNTGGSVGMPLSHGNIWIFGVMLAS